MATNLVGVTHYVAPPTEQQDDFASAFRLRYGAEPTHYSAVAFDTVNVIAEAGRLAGGKVGALRDALKDVTHDGVTGRIHFDNSGQASIGLVVFNWDGSTMVRLGDAKNQ